jgi:hypothetical protein
MTTRLYQSRFFTPPQIVAEVVTEDKWHHNHSQPERALRQKRAQAFMVAALAGLVFTPLADFPGNGDALASTITTSVRYDRTIIFDDLAYSPYVAPAAEDVTVDKYHAPFSLPTLRLVSRQHQTVAFDPQPIPAWGWHPPLSEPTRRVTTRQQQELASIPFIEDAALQAKWFQPFGTPRAAKRAAEYQAAFYSPYFVPAETGIGTELNWWPNLSERIRTRSPVAQQQALIASYYPIADGAPGDDTARAFTVSTSQRFDKTIIFDELAWAPYPVEAVVETVTSDKWFAPFSQPRFVKRVTEGALPFVADGTDRFAWRRPLSEPVRRKSFREGALAFNPLPIPAWGWHPPLSDPTRRKVFLGGGFAHNPALIEDAAIQAKWFQPLGLPRKAQRPPEFPAFSYSPYFVPPVTGTGTEFNWWPNLSEPVRERVTKRHRAAIAASGPIYAAGAVVPVQVFYSSPLEPSGPTYLRVVIAQTLAYTHYVVPPVSGVGTQINWWPNLSERLRQKRAVAQQQALIQGPVSPVTVTLQFGWHRPLAVPTRRKVERQTAGGFYGTYVTPADVETVTQDKWYAALSKPVLRLKPSYFEPLAWGILTPEPAVEPGPTCLHVSMQVCYGSASYDIKVPDSEMRVKVGSATFKLNEPDTEMRVTSASTKLKVGDC